MSDAVKVNGLCNKKMSYRIIYSIVYGVKLNLKQITYGDSILLPSVTDLQVH